MITDIENSLTTQNYEKLNYFKNLNSFLYKFIIINILINILLYYLSSEGLAAITYTFSITYFLINFKKYFKSYFVALFAQTLVAFLINLTYLTFIGTLLINYLVFNTSLNEILIYYLYCDLDTYFLANIYLLIFSSSILFFNNLIPELLKIDVINKINFTNIICKRKNIQILISLCFIFEFFFYFTGMIGSQQSGGFILQDSSDKTTWYTQLYVFVVIFHIFLNVLFFVSNNKKEITFYEKFFLLVSFILSLFFFGFYERRKILIFFTINFFLFLIMNKKKIFSFKMLLVYIFSFFVILQSFTLLQTIRSLNIVYEKDSLKTIIEKGEIFSVFRDKEINKFGRNEFKLNLRTRMFNNHELATLFYYDRNANKDYLNGQLLLNSLIKMIPAVIYPNKKNYVAGETLIMNATDSPLYLGDTTDSLHAYSYADLGLLGLIVYPLIINLIFFIIYKIILIKKILRFSSIYIIAILCPLITIRTIEVTFIDWFVVMRNIIIFIFLFNYLLSFINTNEVKDDK